MRLAWDAQTDGIPLVVSTSRVLLAPCLALLMLGMLPSRASALIEEVLVTHAGTDDAVIQRPSGECWWLDLRQDCFGFRSHKGRTVLLWSPGPDVTTASRLVIPERDASCPIWQADTLSRDAPPAYAGDVPGTGLRAVKGALELLGYDPGETHPGWTPAAALAWRSYRGAKGLGNSPSGVFHAIVALALEIVRGRRTTPEVMQLARLLADHARALAPYLATVVDGVPPLATPTHVGSVASDSSRVTLGDGTRWRLLTEARSVVAHWRAGDPAVTCGDRIVNGRTGDLVRVARLD